MPGRYRVLVVLGLMCGAAYADAPRYNVLFILSDNQAATLLATYGNPDIATPNIDNLAKQGVQFNRAYAVNGMCSATRATLMTGLMPSQHGVHSWLNDHMLKDWPREWVAVQEFRTLPQTLKHRGYKTAMIGKWHLGQPWKPAIGFDHWVTFPLGHTVDFWDKTIIANDKQYRVDDQHIVDHFTDLAVDFIQAHDGEQPFYLQLNYDGPYMNPPTNMGPARNRYYNDYLGRDLESFPRTPLHPDVVAEIRGPVFDPAVDFRNWAISRIALMHNDPKTMANAASQNTVVDDGVGRVLEALQRKGLAENTLVIYSSDQGNFYGQYGLWAHTIVTTPSSPYEAVMRIPLIVRHTGHIAPGRVEDALIGQYDLMPTILDYVGYGDVPIAGSPGQSFVDLLNSDATASRRDAVFFEQEETRGVRTDRFAYWQRLAGTGEQALFDMEADPEQHQDLSADGEFGDVIAGLQARLSEFFGDYAATEFDLWQGGTAKGSVDQPETFKKIYGKAWTTRTDIKPAFVESP